MASSRVGAWLCGALVAMAACSGAGDDDARTAADPGSTTPAPGAPTSDPATGGTLHGPGGAPDAGPDAVVPGVDSDTGAPGSTTVQADPDPTVSPAPPPAPGGVGAYAPFYLQATASEQVLVDVRSQSGAEPTSRTLEHLRTVLAQVSGKRTEVGGGAIGGQGRQWSPEDIRAVADSNGPPQSRDTAVVRLVFLRGGFAGDDTVLGAAVRSDVAAIFSDRVDEAAGVLGNRSRIEDAVTMHEIGHLLGLVDLHLDTGRADPEHPGHSRNSGSVMYYAVESTLVGSILSGGPPTDFDAQDLADLRSIRDG